MAYIVAVDRIIPRLHLKNVKRFFREDDGRIRLQPENPLMAPIFLNPSDRLDIQGVVKGVVRRV